MKKIYYVFILFAFIASLTTNCKDDNGGGIIPPEDTTVWDLKLDYAVELTVSATSYDGPNVEIDFDAIANKFGISKETLLLSIADSISDPDVTLYAIGAPANDDVIVGTATNTNGLWGHWWGATGLNTEWASETDLATVYAEYYAGNTYFTVGQRPGRLAVGQVVQFYEAIKLGDVRVAIHFTVTGKAPEVIEATIVNTQNLNIEVLEKTTYDMDSVEFNLDQTLTDLGVSSMDEVTLIAVNEDGTYAQEKSADNGYWIDRNGFASSWGAGGVVYTDYGSLASNRVGIGQFPDSLSAGEEFTIKFGFLANDKIEMLAITITVVGYIDPETAPTGDPEDLTLDVAMNQAYNDAYTSVSFDVKETLRNAFKMTTYQIHKAIVDGNLLLYQGAVADTVPGYTADAPGFWLNSEGNVTTWGTDSKIWCSLGHSETELYLYGGNHPELAETGDVIVTKLIATCNGGTATFNVTYTIE